MRVREIGFVAVQVENALLQVIVSNGGITAQLLQHGAAVQRQPQDGQRIAPGTAGQAFEKESQPPRPLAQVGAHPEQQRCILPPQPFEDLQRSSGVGPGFGMAHGNLAAVGEAGLHPGRALTVDHRDLVPGLCQIPGAGHADHACTENKDFQFRFPGVELT